MKIPLILWPRHVAEALSPRATTIPVRTALFPLPFFPMAQKLHINPIKRILVHN
jgi:hypothetical protein